MKAAFRIRPCLHKDKTRLRWAVDQLALRIGTWHLWLEVRTFSAHDLADDYVKARLKAEREVKQNAHTYYRP